MKNAMTWLFRICLYSGILMWLISCEDERQGVIPEFDMNGSYETKEFDYSKVFDIKYIPLKTDSLFIGSISMFYASDNLYMGTARRGEDIDIVFINKAGDIFKRINRQGNSNKEYLYISGVFYDDKANEFFIYDSRRKKILVLDGNGEFKRCWELEKGHSVSEIMDYDGDAFITYNSSLGFGDDLYGSYTLVSKEDGRVLKEIPMTCIGEKRYPSIINLPKYIVVIKMRNMIPGNGCVLLSEAYSDTVYHCSGAEALLQPVLTRKPAFNTINNKKKMFLEPILETPDFFLFSILTVTIGEDQGDSEYKEYFYDKNKKKFYASSNKYPGTKNKNNLSYAGGAYNQLAYTLDITTLYKMEEDGSINKELKEILLKSTDEDNPVLVVLTLRK